MSDVFPVEKRSSIMRAIRGRNTEPEHVVRRLLHRLGYRFRTHVRDLPGCPDLVFAARRKIVFVHGCFWHRHSCRRGRSAPATRQAFWQRKLDGNARRDAGQRRRLRALGWSVMTVWECQLPTRKLLALTVRLRRFLAPSARTPRPRGFPGGSPTSPGTGAPRPKAVPRRRRPTRVSASRGVQQLLLTRNSC
jgi:DNA mismatch endonuclease (patch repair protein)